jgi:hypothetical protein
MAYATNAFLLVTYFVDKFLTFLKQRGFPLLPTTDGGSLAVPLAFQANQTIILSL